MFDARVPVVFGDAADVRDDDAVLAGIALSIPGHAVACLCCTTRSPAAEVLSRLFLQRARNEVAFFRRVIVTADAAGEAAVRAALEFDPVVSARFRLD